MQNTNPIEQRIELLADKWTEATYRQAGRIIRILAKPEEEEMVNTFFEYMLALDSSVDEIAILFETVFDNPEEFSGLLLKELDNIIKIWNDTKKPDGLIFDPIDWEPDYSLTDKEEPAALFVRNINKFAEQLLTGTDRMLAPVLFLFSENEKEVNNWLQSALRCGIAENIRLAIPDSTEHQLLDAIATDHPDEVITVLPELDIDNGISQLAAMGDPADPNSSFQFSYVKLCQAIEKRKQKDVQIQADACLQIAAEHVEQNPNWLTQMVVVHIALANNELGNKDYKKAAKEATLALDIARKAYEILDKSLSTRLCGQCFMIRGSILSTDKKWEKALADFVEAAELYGLCKDSIMQVEALRMCGYAADGANEKKKAVQSLVAGLRVGAAIPANVVASSSFPLLVKALLKHNYDGLITDEEIDNLLKPIWGEEWRKVLKQLTDIKDVNYFIQT